MSDQISLFSEERPNLEKLVSIKNTDKNYGIQKRYLNVLRYDDLKDVFFGMHNIDILPNMLIMLNPDEILSIYMAVGAIKRSVVEHTDLKIDYSNIENFSKLIKRFNAITYKGSNLVSVRPRIQKPPHSAMPGQQERRMQDLDDEVKQQFMKSFKKPYFGSVQDEYYGEKAYPDPAYEGVDMPFSKNKKVYVDAIFVLVENMYERNMRKNA